MIYGNPVLILKNNKGATLIMALFLLLLLTLIGIVSNKTTLYELRISANDKLYKTAYFAAEAGIEVGTTALNELKSADSENWNKLLSPDTSLLIWKGNKITSLNNFIDAQGERSIDSITFNLDIKDNDDLDSNNKVDTDNIIKLISTVKNMGANVKIETYIKYIENN
ncbi:MAG: hypothetical protein B6I26_01230 [Desulfobacteraceae bacterium 4572_130]|nr:MAG: hypothetical protein B6I26_01230 [Desulfobacteraceae bacterium 4572_130]